MFLGTDNEQQSLGVKHTEKRCSNSDMEVKIKIYEMLHAVLLSAIRLLPRVSSTIKIETVFEEWHNDDC